jgi:hypothetical protein
MPHTDDFAKIIDKVCDLITAPLLDIYCISRIFKKPKGGVRSDLSICYFGDLHIKDIKDLLLLTGEYELVISKDSKIKEGDNEYYRCLNFSDVKIDLLKDLKNHNK